ncbi:hypothetical protein HZB03_05770, partial [Candidatus Woesearchaeota archaeon]|nr:hypothetical protein [Candidatus Woesearchaeota archaeon]
DKEQKTLGPRTAYGSFGLFYDITSLAYVGGDEDYTSIKVYPALESPLPVAKKIFFYTKESPMYWFGFNTPVPAFKNTTLYLKVYDKSKNFVRLPAITDTPTRFTFFSDPKPPTVEARFPKPGTTADTSFIVYIVLKEGKHESGIDNATISMFINGKTVPFTVKHDLVREKLDASSYYYRIEVPVVNLKDGEYAVAVNARDFARNQISQKPIPSKWNFTVDHLAPKAPEFNLVDGTLGPDDRWYINKPPQFTLVFNDPDPVTIVDTFMDDATGPGGAATCKNTSFNAFLCTFTTPKTAAPGFFWSDYGVLVSAFKTLSDESKSPKGVYGPFEFTVDEEAPQYKLSFNTRVRKSFDLLMTADVANENHPLFSKMKVKGQEFFLLSSKNGSTYSFTWQVPDYSKLAGDEGPATMEFTLSDYAQNANTTTVPIYIDLTPPSATNVDIKISNTVTIGGEQYTSHANVTITGDLVDDDVVAVWTLPGDFNETTGKAADKKMATLVKDPSGIAKSFLIEVKLKGDIGFTEVNNMILVIKDAAGYETFKKLRVIKDLEAPKAPVICVGLFCTAPVGGAGKP